MCRFIRFAGESLDISLLRVRNEETRANNWIFSIEKIQIHQPYKGCHSANMTIHSKPAKQCRLTKDPFSIADIVRHIIHLTSEDQYLHVGTVSKLFYGTWVSKRPTYTRPISKGVTVSQVIECYDSGLGVIGHARLRKNMAKRIVQLNRMDLMLKLESLGYTLCYSPRFVTFSAENANVEMTARLWGSVSLFDGVNNIGYLQDAFCGAMRSGSLDMVSWFVDRGCKVSRHESVQLCRHADVSFVRAVWDAHVSPSSLHEDDISLCVDHAVEAGNLEVVKFLETFLPGPATKYLFAYSAVLSKRLDVLQYVVSNGAKLDHQDIECIGSTGIVEMLEYIKNTPQSIQPGTTLFSAEANVVTRAARYGNIGVLQWYDHNGYNLKQHVRLCGEAAFGGHLEVLKFLRSKGCEYGDTAKFAKRSGNIRLLVWARLNGLVEE